MTGIFGILAQISVDEKVGLRKKANIGQQQKPLASLGLSSDTPLRLNFLWLCANRHDVSEIEAVLDSKIAHRPDTAKAVAENLCADAGCAGEKADATIGSHGYIPHVRPRGEEIKAIRNQHFKPRHWIVEVSRSWFNLFREIKVRYEKTTTDSLALHHLGAATIALLRCHGKNGKNIIYG